MDPTSLTRDFKEFLQSLNDHGVEYLVIGGHAVAFHGYPRATGDLKANKRASGRNKDLAHLHQLP
jgi:predicted nucleotidyltransferase